MRMNFPDASDSSAQPSRITNTVLADTGPANSDVPPGEATGTHSSLPQSAAQPAIPQYTVFISHAGEDKATIAMPLREKLQRIGISSFVDEVDMPPGTDAKQAMMSAMRTAKVTVIVLSPEFVAREWPMRELMHFLQRREECIREHCEPPTIIPCFYRLSIAELHDEPRLDRIDKHGNSLYERSRFYERQRNGDPEASVAGIKAALKQVHGIMGIRNDDHATNDSSLVMSERRKTILAKLCDAVCGAASSTAPFPSPLIKGEQELESESFHSHFDKPDDVSELVFDFNGKDKNENRFTQEGQMLDMILDRRLDENRTIAVWGIAGVGKTSFLERIRSLEIVRGRFRDGVYAVQMSKDAIRSDLCDRLSRAVEKSGGQQTAQRMRSENTTGSMLEEFRSWFAGRECLFVVDDVWETKEVSGVIHDLLTLHTSGRDSKVLLATRSSQIAARAKSPVRLKARQALHDESREILYHYSGLKPGLPREEHAEDNGFVDAILERCGGLPLFLAVAGRAVKSLKLREGHEGCLAYRLYGDKLKKTTTNMVSAGIDSYEGLYARLLISVGLLEERQLEFGFGIKMNLNVAEMHRRLCVVAKQSRVPMSMLRHLWELKDDGQAAIVAKELEQVGLADLEYEIREHTPVEVLRLHDSVHDFAVYETRRSREENVGHEALIKAYGRKVGRARSGCREWWSTRMEADGYIHQNITRHLLGAGRVWELLTLLLSPQWVERQLEVSGMLSLEADFSIGIEAVQEEIEGKSIQEREELKDALELIKKTLILSSGFVSSNRTEIWFQLHGRLRRCRERNRLIGKYLVWIEREAPRPRMLSMNRCLAEPDGPNTKIVSIGKTVTCMVALQHVDRVACGSVDGLAVVVNLRRSNVERMWKAHDTWVVSIAGARDGTRVVTGSTDGSMKVWEVKSSRCIATFTSRPSSIRCIAVTHDGKLVASNSHHGTFTVWEADTARPTMGPIKTYHGTVTCVAFLGDGGKVVTGGSDGKLQVWNTATGAQIDGSFEGHSEVVCLAMTRNEKRIVSGALDGTVRLWDMESRHEIAQVVEGIGRLTRVTASPDGSRIIYICTEDHAIALWDMSSGRRVYTPFIDSEAITEVAFLADESSVVSCSGSWDGTVRVWDMRWKNPEKVSDQRDTNRYVRRVKFTPNNKFVVSSKGDIRLWNAKTGELIGQPLRRDAEYSVTDVTATPEGRYIVTVSDDKKVRVWDITSRSLQYTFTGHTGPISCVTLTPKGDRAVTGSFDQTVRVWDLRSMDGSHAVLEGHTSFVNRVFVSDDGARITSIAFDGNVRVWDIKTRPYQTIRSFHIKPCGGCDGPTIAIVEALELAGEPSPWNPVSKCISVTDGRHIVFDEGSGATVLGTLESSFQRWALSPDGKTMCAGFQDGSVAFLKLQLSSENDRGCIIS